jgi:hypothetical protein
MAQTGTYVPDSLVIGEDLVTDSVTLASGQNIVRGAVLGKVTATGEYVLSLSASTDGSEVPYAIAVDAVDATAAAVTNVAVYIGGEFNESALTLGTGHTVASVKADLRNAGIYIKSAVSK